METIESSKVMQEKCEVFRISGQTIGLVPTMGFFHDGHLELMRAGKRLSDQMIVSIFVNPIQFGPSEDFEVYPRDMEGDLSKAKDVGADFVFCPSSEEMYPGGFQTSVSVQEVTKHLCGLTRPSHFEGVTTVVAKLFNITKPHLAIFGQKDYQQLTVISRMVEDLNMDVKIVGVPTVREPDGLAMSSRNSYLNPEERESALCLKKSLDLADSLYHQGEYNAEKIIEEVEKLIRSHASTEIEYIKICHPASLEDAETVEEKSLLALAVKVGQTRLIDNCLIGRKNS
jgi:pantoate--beta-alanine ligase